MKQTVLITGAGQRIGAALARHLAAQGHALVLHYNRSRVAAETLAQELTASFGVSVALTGWDLSELGSLADFWNGLPPVTGLIHNASLYQRDQLETFSLPALRAHMSVNLEAPLLLSQGFMRQLPADRQGNILVLGDGIKGWSMSPQFFTYALSKTAWESVIDLLAAACAPRARVNLLGLAPTLPGDTDSPEMFARMAERAPLKRTGSVEEVCQAMDYLLTAPGITGQVINLANGMGLHHTRP